jgi:hypothetical protein
MAYSQPPPVSEIRKRTANTIVGPPHQRARPPMGGLTTVERLLGSALPTQQHESIRRWPFSLHGTLRALAVQAVPQHVAESGSLGSASAAWIHPQLAVMVTG